ncbi:MAG: hypothetical protein ABH844_07380 [Candidatus Omnitrophota bacterium]
MRNLMGIFSILIIVVFLAGCGETINGVVKDAKRVSAGVQKIFIRD